MLRWTIFKITFCIMPSFWFMSFLWAFLLYSPIMGQAPGQLLTRELVIMMLLWVLCMFVTDIVHEMGHAFTGRLFGQPGTVTLTGSGGPPVMGYQEIAAWKRILVIAAGPGAGFVLVAVLVALDGSSWNWCMEWLEMKLPAPFWNDLKCRWFLIDRINPGLRTNEIYALMMMLLFVMNLFINLMNLLPIIPMDGGMIFKEVCCLIAPRGGLKFAFGWSFLLAVGLTIYLLLIVLVRYGFISDKYALYYPFAFPEFSLIIFAMLAFQCWQTYQRLSTMERYMDYYQDDMSGARPDGPGFVEVPVKDPGQFAPRAPGSERPRR